MRVLAYLFSYPPYRMVGGEMMTSRLLEALAARGHEVKVLAQHIGEPFTRNGVQIVPRRSTLRRDEIQWAEVLISHPEITHYLINRAPCPYVGIVHNLGPDNVEQLHEQRFSLLVANSEDTRAQIAEMGMTHEVSVMHPPTLPEWSSPPLVAQVGRQFVTQINLGEAKGGETFWRLAAEHPDLPFLGVLGGYSQQVIPEDRPDNVTLLGQSPEMGLIYAMTRVLLQPTHSETYGMAGAEAMLHGIPVVSSDVGGVRDALGDAALYVSAPEDVAGFSKALTALQDSRFAAASAEAARERGVFLAERSRAQIEWFCDAVERLAPA